MKEYATLKVGINSYKLFDSREVVIVKGIIDEHHYIWQASQPLNQLSQQGWDVEYKIQSGWFMMSKKI